MFRQPEEKPKEEPTEEEPKEEPTEEEPKEEPTEEELVQKVKRTNNAVEKAEAVRELIKVREENNNNDS